MKTHETPSTVVLKMGFGETKGQTDQNVSRDETKRQMQQRGMKKRQIAKRREKDFSLICSRLVS